MPYKAEVYNIMLASPSDVNDERNIARDLIFDWNHIHASTRKIILLPLSWEYNSVPSMVSRPQGIINDNVLKNADILVGIFWTRIGTPTGLAISGTVEEIEKHIESGKPAMLYFSQKKENPESIDPKQFKAVKNLKKEYQKKGLTTDFDSSEDFRSKFQRHLSMKLNEPDYLSVTNEISTSDSELSTSQAKYNLSNEAKLLLKEASQDPSGEIMKLRFMGGGIEIQTNGKEINEDDSPRTMAKWEAVISQLVSLDLISDVGYKGEIFHLTDMGYKIADELN